ncbi:hypothetical protein Ait01nite_091940 [Actinoplanes italicus]|uniref:Uncharacterized protein DUF1963 n=1 Tax=Actinoplanes italicus TaxID=113567 RepID=A0A2T0K2J5_9ACTN|nr:DUF1963 domain-containing protein [Actinoplanes italicus]PRX17018.1 uncharacterized protein DUF1963 [Actinoplanes italicus]GIE36149.1 hypothetical protein Ait01nite_091940 [Actinoplanes italicus]
MDHQGRFRGAALAAGVPDDEIGRFLEHLRLSVRLGGGAGGVPAGRSGGLPRLAVGREWPSAGDAQLPFVFSVDCAALPPVDGSALPAGGSLLFFLDHEEDHLAGAEGDHRYARVVYVPAGAETRTVEPRDPAIVAEGYDLHATLVAELPGRFTPDGDEDEYDEDDLSPFQQRLADDLERDLPQLEELVALAGELWPPGGGLATACLGGYVDEEVITSIAEQSLAGREKAGEIVIPVASWYSHVEREAHRLTGEWLSLARFPAGDHYDASFVIRHDDLAAGRVDRALSVTGFSE